MKNKISQDSQDHSLTELISAINNLKNQLINKTKDNDITIDQLQFNSPVHLRPLHQVTSIIENVFDEIGRLHQDLEKLKAIINQNQQTLVNTYSSLLPLTQVFTTFSKELHIGKYPLELFKSFRILYEYFSEVSITLHKYISFNEEFNGIKQNYIEQQMEMLTHVINQNNENSSTKGLSQQYEDNYEKDSEKKYNQQVEQNNGKEKQYKGKQKQLINENKRLMRQIEHLQNLIQENNQEYSLQIQKYNKILYQKDEELQRFYRQNKDICELEYLLEQKEIQIQKFRDQKFRDQLMIENMTRKLRIFQKEKGSILLSPKDSNTRISYFSPGQKRGNMVKPSR